MQKLIPDCVLKFLISLRRPGSSFGLALAADPDDCPAWGWSCGDCICSVAPDDESVPCCACCMCGCCCLSFWSACFCLTFCAPCMSTCGWVSVSILSSVIVISTPGKAILNLLLCLGLSWTWWYKRLAGLHGWYLLQYRKWDQPATYQHRKYVWVAS